MRLIAFIFAILLVAARAVNTIETDFTCPMDGAHWKQTTETSAHVAVMRLDRREIGDVTDPRTLPQCPKCRFVMFLSDWADIQPLADRLRPFIRGAEYQMIAAKRPTYFCLAQIQEFLKAPPLYIGQSYLRAAWQVEENETMSARYLAFALTQFTKAAATMEPSHKEYANTLLLCGELERRLGQWAAAENRFLDYQAAEPFRAPNHQTVIALQLQLIAAHDSKPHLLEGKAPAAVEMPHLSLSSVVPTKDAALLTEPKPISIKLAPKPKSKLLGSP